MTATYDAENHLLTKTYGNWASGQAKYDGEFAFEYRSSQFVYGPNGHPVKIKGEIVYWDGDQILATVNSGTGVVDGVKAGVVADFASAASNSPFVIWDRDLGGNVTSSHNQTGFDSWYPRDPSHREAILAIFPAPNAPTPSPSYNGGITIPAITEPGTDGYFDGTSVLQGARAYDPELQAWTAPDAYSGEIGDPMSRKSYAWNRNNPYAYSDPSGYCSDPGGSGVRVCVDAFIQQGSVMLGTYAGDNRSFSGNLNPDTYRVHADLNFSTQAQHAVIGNSHDVGVTDPGTGSASVTFTSTGATVHFDAHAGGLLNGVSPAVKADLTLTLGKDGTVSITGDHTQFPSFEVYVYGGKNNGALYTYTENPMNTFGPLFLNRGEDVHIGDSTIF